MKNISKHYTREDIHRTLFGMWQTDVFRDSHNQNGVIYKIVDMLADRPMFFFDVSDEKLETAHFSAWWGGIQRRTYSNPYIQDLYYLHEIMHLATMIHIPDLEFENFKKKMFDNELIASTLSEIQIYFELPELRQKSFPHDIYADRFLKDELMQKRWADSPERLVEELKIRRRNVMTDQNPKDTAEYWIRQFAAQNDGWASIWHDRYNTVETAMRRYYDNVLLVGREQALDDHVAWLTSDEISQGGEIPFPEEAHAFAAIYWKNKNSYVRAMQTQAKPTPKKGPQPS